MRYISKGSVCIAFAAGLLVASLFPYKLAVLIIAAVITVAGLSLCRF